MMAGLLTWTCLFVGPSCSDIFRILPMYGRRHLHWFVVIPLGDGQFKSLSNHHHWWCSPFLLQFIMSPVAGKLFSTNASMRMTDVRYWSKNRWLDVGRDSNMCRTAAAPMPIPFPLVHLKIQHQTSWRGKDKHLQASRVTNCLIGQPVKGMMCSSMQSFPGFGR